ncbi:MAG: hypothetical protein PWQ68_2369 [Thermoanaerobacteraceae bacterium]|nr:hypothetical protein [Thermoanaerobacteraceae bacterium]
MPAFYDRRRNMKDMIQHRSETSGGNRRGIHGHHLTLKSNKSSQGRIKAPAFLYTRGYTAR